RASAALLAGAVNKERATYGDERTVVLSAGDMMQGTPISNVLKGKPVIDVMNQMKFDAMEIGNHEFDWGAATLNQNLTNAAFPFLAANLRLKDGDSDADSANLISNLKPYTIVEKDGVKVGVIGVINPETANIVMPSIIQHFEIVDPAAKVNQYVPLVKAAGADVVVVLSHIGDQYNYWPGSGAQPATLPLSQDLANLAKGITGVDAVFGGHSHTTNYDMVPDATGKRIPAIIGYANGRGAGVIRLALDQNNQVMGAVPSYLDVYNRLYGSLTPDSAVQAIVNAANAQIGPIFSVVIGKAEVDMLRSTASSGNLDSNLGDWAADVTKSAGNADFGFQNSGGLRIDLPKGDVTVGQIWTLMPFDNEINVMDMTGAQVKKVLEYMVSGAKTPGHISGFKFAWDPNKPVNSRVVKFTLPDGSPVDMNKVYKVAAPDFIATGGDGYPFPANSANLANPHILVRDALIDDLKARKILNYQPDGRIQYYVQPVVTSTLGSSIIALADCDFTINTVANSELNSPVRFRFTLVDPEQRSDIKLKYAENGEYYQLEFDKAGQTWFGPQAGMPLVDATYPFKVKFIQEGTFAYTLDLVEVNTGLVLASKTESITVTSKVHNAAK
ncbi:MAG TPA: 5'-nucleotidase C-terminal domain-containing protein, partial [Verrucomicrobiae bacterium]|nr:5'-nucleotidase C-terminal domain-containing protein [Verrucomicrobiae bacterium]